MIFKNGIYDKLKWFCLVGFPAIITFFGVLGSTLEWDFTQMVITIAVAFNTMLGTMLGISNIRYNRLENNEYGEEIEEEE
ncbi:MAG: holin [Bacilli bacterium]|nr:holin [Bacilli bacterium]